jgi:hypothetical protein
MPEPASQESNDSDLMVSLRDEPQRSLPSEFFLFLKQERLWWMLPILIVLGLTTVIAALTTTGVAPFIYTLF